MRPLFAAVTIAVAAGISHVVDLRVREGFKSAFGTLFDRFTSGDG